MRLIVLSFISLLSLIGFVKVGANTEPQTTREDKEFQQLMNDFHKTMDHNKQVQVKADETKDKLIEITTKEITKLSTENKVLKTELNEVKAQLDSVVTDSGKSINILPISHYKKD